MDSTESRAGVFDDDGRYQPIFGRLSTERRVLGHVTDEDHVGRGPRNTLERLDQELTEDPYTDYDGLTTELEGMLGALVDAGLLERRADGTYGVTDAGLVELTN